MVELPLDYLRFLSVYGAGYFSTSEFRQLSIYDLTTLNWGGFHDSIFALNDLHGVHPRRFPIVFPAEGGLLPWGDWDEGFILTWRTSVLHPSMWPVVVVGPREDMVETYDFGMTEYLARSMGIVEGLTIGGKTFAPNEGIRFYPD